MRKVLVRCATPHKEDVFSAAEDEYLRRMRPRLAVELVGPASTRGRTGTSVDAERLLSSLPADETVVALDGRGRTFTSADFAAFVLAVTDAARRPVSFLIGGPEGWDPSVPARADHLVSLSPLTFPHRLARVILLEQLYRSTTIWNNMPYHK